MITMKKTLCEDCKKFTQQGIIKVRDIKTGTAKKIPNLICYSHNINLNNVIVKECSNFTKFH